MAQVQERFDDDFADDPGEAPREVHLAEYWAVVVKRWRMVAVCVAAAIVVTAVKTLLSTPLYKATVVLNVEKDRGNPVDIGGQQRAQKNRQLPIIGPRFLLASHNKGCESQAAQENGHQSQHGRVFLVSNPGADVSTNA